MNQIVTLPTHSLPALIDAAGERARWRFLEFFTAHIHNPNTRRAYSKDVGQFLDWCQAQGVRDITKIHTLHVATYVELLTKSRAAPTAKRHVSAIRRLFDWLVTGQIILANPALSVRPPRHSQRRGKTPILDADEARALLDSIDTSTLLGIRDRALIALMIFAFSRIGACESMKVGDVSSVSGDYGCGCTKRVARSVRCPAITRWKQLLMPGSRPVGSATIPRPRCFPAVRGGWPATTPHGSGPERPLHSLPPTR